MPLYVDLFTEVKPTGLLKSSHPCMKAMPKAFVREAAMYTSEGRAI